MSTLEHDDSGAPSRHGAEPRGRSSRPGVRPTGYSVSREDLRVLAYFGADVVAEGDSTGCVSTGELVVTAVRVLDRPNARLVGAVLQALIGASRTLPPGEQLSVGQTDVPPSRPGLMRLGYLSQRLAERHTGPTRDNLVSLSDSVMEALELVGPPGRDELLPLSGRLRRSDARRQHDALTRRWRVTSRPDVWEHYVHVAQKHW